MWFKESVRGRNGTSDAITPGAYRDFGAEHGQKREENRTRGRIYRLEQLAMEAAGGGDV